VPKLKASFIFLYINFLKTMMFNLFTLIVLHFSTLQFHIGLKPLKINLLTGSVYFLCNCWFYHHFWI